ncbi:MAG: sugar transferase [Chloroflexi bacterium]|nr:sugar transferase [Chloroflexota bacterium]
MREHTRRCARPRWKLAIKRAMDVSGALAGLIVLSPVLVAAGALVRVTSPGPILYHWHIAARDGRPVTSYKFRTMVQNADDLKPLLQASNEMGGPFFKMRNDPRVTRAGRLLRRFSIDELPQLWSIVKGDLSLVGPRPPLWAEFEHFTPEQRQKLAVQPGLTCWWQVSGRHRIADPEEWLRLDLKYIDEWSLRDDLRILAKTALVILHGTGA